MATLLMLSLASCHKEEDDLFATGCIMLSTPDGMAIDMVQAQAILTNVNTRQVTTTSDFKGERHRGGGYCSRHGRTDAHPTVPLTERIH